MGIAVTQQVQRTGWGGDETPFPSGMWFGSITKVGDGSGGVIILDLQFAPAGGARDTQLYSLEQYSVAVEETGGTNLRLQGFNFTLSPTGPSPDVAWFYVLALSAETADPSPRLAMLSQRDLRRLFLGTQDQLADKTAVRFILPNTNLKSNIVTGMGYIWDARARSFPGGPKLPLGAILAP